MYKPSVRAAVGSTAVVAIVCGAAIMSSSWASGSRSAPAKVRDTRVLAPVDHAVSAGELWGTAVDALACFRDHGADAAGPYPAADGLSIDYSVRVSTESQRWEPTCTAALNARSLRFATDNDTRAVQEAPAADGPEDLEPLASPPTAEAEALARIRADLLTCIGAPSGGSPSDDDRVLDRVASDAPDRFAECVAEIPVEAPERTPSTTADLGGSSAAPACAVPSFPTLGDLPAGAEVEVQPDDSFVSLLVTFGGSTPEAAAHRWVSVEVAAGPKEVAPPGSGQTASIATAEGTVEARVRTEHRTDGGADDDLWRLDWGQPGARVTAMAWNVDEGTARSVLRALELTDRAGFDRWLDAEGIEPACS